MVIVACVQGSILASTLDTLRNGLGLNRPPAKTLLCKTHLAAIAGVRWVLDRVGRGGIGVSGGSQGVEPVRDSELGHRALLFLR